MLLKSLEYIFFHKSYAIWQKYSKNSNIVILNHV